MEKKKKRKRGNWFSTYRRVFIPRLHACVCVHRVDPFWSLIQIVNNLYIRRTNFNSHTTKCSYHYHTIVTSHHNFCICTKRKLRACKCFVCRCYVQRYLDLRPFYQRRRISIRQLGLASLRFGIFKSKINSAINLERCIRVLVSGRARIRMHLWEIWAGKKLENAHRNMRRYACKILKVKYTLLYLESKATLYLNPISGILLTKIFSARVTRLELPFSFSARKREKTIRGFQ